MKAYWGQEGSAGELDSEPLWPCGVSRQPQDCLRDTFPAGARAFSLAPGGLGAERVKGFSHDINISLMASHPSPPLWLSKIMSFKVKKTFQPGWILPHHREELDRPL